MTVQPYYPMNQPPLATEADHTRMAAILARHAKTPDAEADYRETSVREAVCQPLPTSAPLEWGKPCNTGPGTAMIKSVCGRFRIDKVASQLSVGYTAWALKAADLGLNKRLGCAETADEAKALCQAAP